MRDDIGHNIDFLKESDEATSPGSGRRGDLDQGALAETGSLPVAAALCRRVPDSGDVEVLVATSTSTFAVCAKMENSKGRISQR
jgi:hypothetical protein